MTKATSENASSNNPEVIEEIITARAGFQCGIAPDDAPKIDCDPDPEDDSVDYSGFDTWEWDLHDDPASLQNSPPVKSGRHIPADELESLDDLSCAQTEL